MAEFEIHITDFKVSADKDGWISFWCRNNSDKTVPKIKARYAWWVDKDGVKVCGNATGQPRDFKPGDVVTMNNRWVGAYSFEPGTYDVTVQWRWSEGGITISDTKTYTIKPEPIEGEAVITSVKAPSSFTPNVSFNVVVHIRNDGVGDWLFARLINRDTGIVIKEGRKWMTSAGAWTWTISVTLPQMTNFRGRVEAGHET